VVFGLGGVALIILAAGAFVAFSVWVENRFPKQDSKHPVLAAARRVVTRPVVNALSRGAEAYVRKRAEAPFMYSWLSLDETIARFLDQRVPIEERRLYAYRLARDGSPKAVEALLKVFQSAAPQHKAFMAQLIGSTRNPQAKAWLWLLLDDPNRDVVLATIRGLSAIGGDDVTSRIIGILNDEQRSDQVRVEAAIGLGVIGTPKASGALVEMLARVPTGELAVQILNSLSRFEFSNVSTVFEEYLGAPDANPKMRVAAVEALANGSAESVPFLLKLAGSDADPDVRASAAWAISAHTGITDQGPALSSLVQHETEADVRRRLYEGLLAQDSVSPDQLLPIVQSEEDLAARVAGFNAVGQFVRQQPVSPAATIFNDQIVPELVQIATSPTSLNLQMRAVFALRRAQTGPAQAALMAIANSARPEVATNARNGLLPPNR